MADTVPPGLVADFPLTLLIQYPGYLPTLLTEKPLTATVALRQLEVFLGAISQQINRVKVIVMTDLRSGELTEYPDNSVALAAFAEVRTETTELLATFSRYLSRTWLTETVVALRDAILAEKAFDRLPVLADALEEAGCDNRFILDHLRGDDDHTHMCWVLDLLSVG